MTEGVRTTAQHENRVAVVFIHGQGQQRPMEDVQELARSVWEADPKRRGEGRRPKTWTVPDARLGLADLGRVTTEAGNADIRVDFFELYWAHLMAGNKFDHFLGWFQRLQARPRREAPSGLLPVRQGVIRFTEAIALLSMLLVYFVALLMPPLPDGVSAEQASIIAPPPVQFAVSLTPGDMSVILTVVGALGILAAWLVLLLNEVLGGAPRFRNRSPSLLVLKARAVVDSAGVWWTIGVFLGLGLLLVHQLIWQGPWLDWADLRLPLLIVAAASAWLLAFRQLAASAMLGVGGAVVALACALYAGLDVAHLWNYGPHVSDWLEGPRAWMAEAGLRDWLLNGLYLIYTFAGLWALASVNSTIGAQRNWVLRLFFTASIIALSWFVSEWMAARFYRPPEMRIPWAVYSGGVTLAVVGLVGYVLTVIASKAFLVPVMTDSARYFSRDPENIEARQQIRRTGVALLDKLHQPDANYDRVIIVAHSLGTAVGYELLMDYWGRQCGSYTLNGGDQVSAAFAEVERCAQALNVAPDSAAARALRSEFRRAQRVLSRALSQMQLAETTHGHAPGKRWLISDFVTLGSPLTHASLLMADSHADLYEKQAERKLATCPPIMFDPDGEVDSAGGSMSFSGWDGQRRPIHSAVFAPVRWTNHFFKVGQWIGVGDVIGGPLTHYHLGRKSRRAGGECADLGRGIIDVESDRLGTGRIFAHNEYWRSALSTEDLAKHLAAPNPKPQHIVALIEALDLDDRALAL